MQITAAVLRDDRGYALEEVALPEPGPGQVLVRVVSAGVCHTDSLLRTMPAGTLPMIPGHEGAGVVEAIGTAVRHIRVGDHVVLSYDYCGTCRNCRSAQTSYCDEFVERNLTGRSPDDGPGAIDVTGTSIGWRWFGQSSFATHAIGTAHNAVVVDPAADLTVLGPLGCGIQTGAGSVLHALAVRPGSTLAVLGAGAVGLAAVMAGVVAGASRIVAVDLHPQRLELALSLGATGVIDGSTPDLLGELLDRTHGGADCALDTTGRPGMIVAALGSVRMTGTLALVSAGDRWLELDPKLLFGRRVIGVFEGGVVPQLFIPKLIELWQAGRFPFHRLIEKFELGDADEAERASREGKVVKPVLVPAP